METRKRSVEDTQTVEEGSSSDNSDTKANPSSECGEGFTCIRCRKGKRACDRRHPCGRCERLGFECIPQTRGRGRPRIDLALKAKRKRRSQAKTASPPPAISIGDVSGGSSGSKASGKYRGGSISPSPSPRASCARQHGSGSLISAPPSPDGHSCTPLRPSPRGRSMPPPPSSSPKRSSSSSSPVPPSFRHDSGASITSSSSLASSPSSSSKRTRKTMPAGVAVKPSSPFLPSPPSSPDPGPAPPPLPPPPSSSLPSALPPSPTQTVPVPPPPAAPSLLSCVPVPLPLPPSVSGALRSLCASVQAGLPSYIPSHPTAFSATTAPLLPPMLPPPSSSSSAPMGMAGNCSLLQYTTAPVLDLLGQQSSSQPSPHMAVAGKVGGAVFHHHHHHLHIDDRYTHSNAHPHPQQQQQQQEEDEGDGTGQERKGGAWASGLMQAATQPTQATVQCVWQESTDEQVPTYNQARDAYQPDGERAKPNMKRLKPNRAEQKDEEGRGEEAMKGDPEAQEPSVAWVDKLLEREGVAGVRFELGSSPLDHSKVRCNAAMERLFYSEQEVRAMGSQLHVTTPAILTSLMDSPSVAAFMRNWVCGVGPESRGTERNTIVQMRDKTGCWLRCFATLRWHWESPERLLLACRFWPMSTPAPGALPHLLVPPQPQPQPQVQPQLPPPERALLHTSTFVAPVPGVSPFRPASPAVPLGPIAPSLPPPSSTCPPPTPWQQQHHSAFALCQQPPSPDPPPARNATSISTSTSASTSAHHSAGRVAASAASQQPLAEPPLPLHRIDLPSSASMPPRPAAPSSPRAPQRCRFMPSSSLGIPRPPRPPSTTGGTADNGRQDPALPVPEPSSMTWAASADEDHLIEFLDEIVRASGQPLHPDPPPMNPEQHHMMLPQHMHPAQLQQYHGWATGEEWQGPRPPSSLSSGAMCKEEAGGLGGMQGQGSQGLEGNQQGLRRIVGALDGAWGVQRPPMEGQQLEPFDEEELWILFEGIR